MQSHQVSLTLERLAKKFNYDWNDSKTAETNRAVVSEIESFLHDLPDDYNFSNVAHAKMFCDLLYKLSTYYLHYTREFEKALTRLTTVEELNKQREIFNAEEMADLYKDLAYAYQQKMQKEGNKNHEHKVLDYCNLVISKEHNIKTLAYQNKVAYVKIVIGHIARDHARFDKAESLYMAALNFYEASGSTDEQYIRLKNTLAQVVEKQIGREEDASRIFREISEYWSKLDHSRNHYAANHYMAYARHCLKNGSFEKAAELIQKTIGIYKLTYDKNSKDYFIFSDLPRLSNEIYMKLPKDKQDKNEELKAYILKLNKPERNLFEFWTANKKTITAGVAIAALGVAATAFALRKK